jgi:hypothetical protein
MSVSEDSVPEICRDHLPFDVIEAWRTVLCVTCLSRPLTANDPYGQCKECAESELYSLFLV